MYRSWALKDIKKKNFFKAKYCLVNVNFWNEIQISWVAKYAFPMGVENKNIESQN